MQGGVDRPGGRDRSKEIGVNQREKATDTTESGLPAISSCTEVSLLITVPVYGQHEYSHALVEDLEREGADYLIVDNRGDYPKLGNEQVIRPGENLGWTGGSELGFRVGFSDGYSHVMTLNNDTRISKGFVAALLDSRIPDDAGLIGPVYDDAIAFKEILSVYDGPAAEYTPVPRYRKLSVLDGTALVLTRQAWRKIGGWTSDHSAATGGRRRLISTCGSNLPGSAYRHRDGVHQPLRPQDCPRGIRQTSLLPRRQVRSPTRYAPDPWQKLERGTHQRAGDPRSSRLRTRQKTVSSRVKARYP